MVSTPICSFIPEVFPHHSLFLSGICIADAFGIHNKHGCLMERPCFSLSDSTNFCKI